MLIGLQIQTLCFILQTICLTGNVLWLKTTNDCPEGPIGAHAPAKNEGFIC